MTVYESCGMEEIMNFSYLTTASYCIFILLVSVNVRRVYLQTKHKWPILSLILMVTFGLIFVWIPLHLLLVILWLYRNIVHYYLRFKHRSDFGGIIGGSDVIYLPGDHERNVISVLVMLECTKMQRSQNIYVTYKKIIHDSFFTDPDKFLPLHCAYKMFGGYCYMVRVNPSVDDCVKKMDNVKTTNGKLNEDDLTELLNKCCNGPLPKNNTLFWDSFVGTQPVNWSVGDRSNVLCYPVLIRVHHSISDGFAVGQLFSIVADKHAYSKQDSLHSYVRKLKQQNTHEKLWYKITIIIYALIYNISEVLMLILKKNSVSILRDVRLSNVEIRTIKIGNGDHFKKIKRIKDSISGARFSHIVLTAISASFEEFLMKKSQCPEQILLAVPSLPKATLLLQIPLGQLKPKNISFHNSFIMFKLVTPLVIRDYKNSDMMMHQRFGLVQKYTEKTSNSIVNKFWTEIALQVIPIAVLERTNDILQWTNIVSILPGPGQVSLNNGNLAIRNILFWTPLLNGVGINISLLTYDNKLHFGLKVDKALISNVDDAQSILNGIFKYLDIFAQEVELKTQ